MKRIGLLVTVTLLTATLSACCFGPHWGDGHHGGRNDAGHHGDRR
ncbi:hypothetical protein [Serratia sp. AKBS12]|nr:hypothetical protein [Serratia sp. AKBS12]MCS3408913.1 hypothetical protein [Serratia sp. AKBS12]